MFVQYWIDGYVLFNDSLNTFYLWLYGVRHMVKEHTERGNLLLLHGLLFPISSKGSLYASSHIPWSLLHQSWSTGWNEKYLIGSTMKDRSDNPSHHEQTILPQSNISLPCSILCTINLEKKKKSISNIFYILSFLSILLVCHHVKQNEKVFLKQIYFLFSFRLYKYR